MISNRLGFVLLISFWAPMLCLAAKPKACVSAKKAEQMINKDICVAAHVYEIVERPDGTRFLDVCPPETPDSACRFTVISFAQDKKAVGELGKYRGKDVRIRGIVQSAHGRAVMVLSRARQFNGGPPAFRPNPLLLHGFSADQRRPPERDPNLHTYGRSRTYTNSRDQETRPAR